MCNDTQQTLQWMSDALEAAEARAEAETERYETERRGHIALLREHHRVKQQLAVAQGRIAELERLVPVPFFLDKVAEALGLSSDGEWRGMRKELRATAAAIREYREASDGKS